LNFAIFYNNLCGQGFELLLYYKFHSI